MVSPPKKSEAGFLSWECCAVEAFRNGLPYERELQCHRAQSQLLFNRRLVAKNPYVACPLKFLSDLTDTWDVRAQLLTIFSSSASCSCLDGQNLLYALPRPGGAIIGLMLAQKILHTAKKNPSLAAY